MVHCHCQRCNDEAVTFSEFEAHADAKAGRPGDTIVLSDCGATLRVNRRHSPAPVSMALWCASVHCQGC